MGVEYLRAFDDDLDGALALLIDDVVTAGFSPEQAEAMVREAADLRLEWINDQLDGETALYVVDTLQDDITMELRSAWPECPEHGSHPLSIQVEDPAAMWTCPKSRRAWAPLGGLSSLRTGDA
jgi:hypothetical protein